MDECVLARAHLDLRIQQHCGLTVACMSSDDFVVFKRKLPKLVKIDKLHYRMNVEFEAFLDSG